jgi:hypothetical protein
MFPGFVGYSFIGACISASKDALAPRCHSLSIVSGVNAFETILAG